MQQRNFLCPKLGLGGGAGAVWEELDNERKRWQDPHSCNALEINALSIGRLCISTSVYSYCSKNKYENDTLFFFTPNTLFLKESQNKASSQHIVSKHTHYTMLFPLYKTSFCIFASRFYFAPTFYVNASTGGDPVQFFGQIVYICILRCGGRFV